MTESSRKPRMDLDSLFGRAEELRLHQLRLLEWMHTAGRKRFVDDTQPPVVHEPLGIPDIWKLTNGVEPHAWQQQCIAEWRRKRATEL